MVPEWYEAPTFYFTNPYALVGAHDDVPGPAGVSLLDFELEVAVVVGRDGASLTPRSPASTSSATRSSTTGPPATCSAGR